MFPHRRWEAAATYLELTKTNEQKNSVSAETIYQLTQKAANIPDKE